MVPKGMFQYIRYVFGTLIILFCHLNGDFLTRRRAFFQDSKGLKHHHSRVPPVSLQVHAKAYAGGGGCPTWLYIISDAF